MRFAAKELDELRSRWLNPPEWTKTEVLEFPGLAHKKLDAAVFAAYGWDAAMSDEELLERLLRLNLGHA
jgi:hypothetical protein